MCDVAQVIITTSKHGPAVRVTSGDGVRTEHAADVAVRVYRDALIALQVREQMQQQPGQ